jgi:hypothetical protein
VTLWVSAETVSTVVAPGSAARARGSSKCHCARSSPLRETSCARLYVFQSGASYCKLCNVERPVVSPDGHRRAVHHSRDNTSTRTRRPAVSFEQTEMEEVTAISTLRRDAFCSLHAAGAEAEAHRDPPTCARRRPVRRAVRQRRLP